MSESPKIIREKGATAEKWSVPVMNSTSSKVFKHEEETEKRESESEEAANIPTALDIEQWHKEAHEEGYQEGLKQAQQEMNKIKQRFLGLMNFLDKPLQSMNEEVEEQLNLLAVTLAQQLVKRELKTEPGEIIGVIREAVQLLPASSRKISITLNPEDAELVRSSLTLDKYQDDINWRIIEDPMTTRGGCEIKSDHSVINVTLENRLQSLAASMLGGEREEDQK